MSGTGGYRVLLSAYPGRLRRKHGAELIDTLFEMAGSGGRPTRAEKGRLMLDGLGERFRPPTRRPLALLAAVLALAIGGALGAAAGSWLGTFGYAAMPPAATLAKHLDKAATWSNSDNYLYAAATVPDGTDLREATDRTRQRLAAAGWQTGAIEAGDGSDGILPNVHFTAQNADVQLDVYAYPDANGERSIVLSGWPKRPAGYLPLTIAGTLLGLVAGWLAGVALTHRIQAARRPRTSSLLTAAGLALVVPAAAGFVASLVRYLTATDPLTMSQLVHGDGFAFGPTIYLMRWLDRGEGSSLFNPSDWQWLSVWGFALIAVAAILARPRRPFEAVRDRRVS